MLRENHRQNDLLPWGWVPNTSHGAKKCLYRKRWAGPQYQSLFGDVDASFDIAKLCQAEKRDEAQGVMQRGNTCYMASVLTCLQETSPELRFLWLAGENCPRGEKEPPVVNATLDAVDNMMAGGLDFCTEILGVLQFS